MGQFQNDCIKEKGLASNYRAQTSVHVHNKKAFKGTVLGNIPICFLAELAEKIETTLLFSLKFLSHKFWIQKNVDFSSIPFIQFKVLESGTHRQIDSPKPTEVHRRRQRPCELLIRPGWSQWDWTAGLTGAAGSFIPLCVYKQIKFAHASSAGTSYSIHLLFRAYLADIFIRMADDLALGGRLSCLRILLGGSR